jgi:15-cis-phytoene synthase
MARQSIQTAVFKGGSRTYATSSVFFPAGIRRDVEILYGFVRVADDFVDAVPQNAAGFEALCSRYRAARAGLQTGDQIVDDFVELSRRKRFDPAWTEAFLDAMRADLERSTYDSLEDVTAYMYGSAEVIGLFMARIMDLPEEALPYARLLGRAMQYINFIRDIEEDIRLGRRYLPLEGSGLSRLDRDEAARNPREFRRFIVRQLERYEAWQREATRGFRLIPWRYRVAIRTASDMYRWTARRIARDPGIVFQRKVKPGKPRIVLSAIGNTVAGLA